MKNMLFVFAVSIACVGSASTQTYFMNIRMKGGGTTSIPIDEIRKLTFTPVTAVEGERWTTVIKTFRLLQNYPNPFNPSTTIEYQLPKSGMVDVRIYNAAGQLVRALESGIQSPGGHTVTWDGHDDAGMAVASGMYYYQVAFEDGTLSKKMILIK